MGDVISLSSFEIKTNAICLLAPFAANPRKSRKGKREEMESLEHEIPKDMHAITMQTLCQNEKDSLANSKSNQETMKGKHKQ